MLCFFKEQNTSSFPSSLVGRTLHFTLPGARVRSLVRELRSHKSCVFAKNQKSRILNEWKDLLSKKQWTSWNIARAIESPMNSGQRLGQKTMFKRDIEGKKINKKEMECLVICTCSWAAQLDKWCFRKGYPPARTLKLWLYYFSFEKNFISTKKNLVLSFFLMFLCFIYLFILAVLRLAVCVAAHGLCFRCSEQGLFFLAVHRFLVMVESLFYGAQAQ